MKKQMICAIRSNAYNIIPREEWEVIEDCHEDIIDKADWERMQEILDRRPPIMKGNSCPYYNIFLYLLYKVLIAGIAV